MAVTFANGRSRLVDADWSITTSVGGTLSAQTKYFSIQAANNIGYNLILVSDEITIEQNEKVTIIINTSAIKSGEGWTHFVIGVSDSPTETSFNQLAKIPVYEYDVDGNILYDSPNATPLTVVFSTDSHLETEGYSTTLPTTNLINGMRRGLSTTNVIYELNIYAVGEADNDYAIEAPVGLWLKKDTFSNYVLNTQYAGGCAVDLLYLTDFRNIEIPRYTADGTASSRVNYFVVNDTGFDLAAGMSVTLNVQVSGYEKSDLFDGKITYKIKGFVDLDTGLLRTTYYDTLDDLLYIDLENQYSSRYPTVVLEDVVKANEAIAIELYVNFNEIEFNGLLPDGYLQILPQVIETVGTFSPMGGLFNEGVIYNQLNKRRILPLTGLKAKVTSGTGLVKDYIFFKPDSGVLVNLVANTSSQDVYINRNGLVYLSTTPSEDSLLRAVVDTTPKESKVSAWTDYTAVGANHTLLVNVTYPCDSDLECTIRCDYPDVIGGSTGEFNPDKLNLYIQRQSDGEIRKFSNIAISAFEPQNVTITSWSGGTVVTSFPTTSGSFYDPLTNTLSTISSGGDFTSGNYRVAHSFVWSGGTVSDISHSTGLGCITEASITGEQVFGSIAYNTPAEIRTLTNLYNGRLAYCVNNEQLYSYSATNIETDNGFDYLEPDNEVGRWVNVKAGSTRTYVHLYDPTAENDITDGYYVGDRWINNGGIHDSFKEYTLLDNTENNAVWREVGTGNGSVEEGGVNWNTLTENTTWYVSTTGLATYDGLAVDTPLDFKTAFGRLKQIDFNGFILTIQLANGVYNEAITGLYNDNFYDIVLEPDAELVIIGASWVGVVSEPTVTIEYLPIYRSSGRITIENIKITDCVDIDCAAYSIVLRNLYFDTPDDYTQLFVYGTTYVNLTGLIKINTDVMHRFVKVANSAEVGIDCSFDPSSKTINTTDAFVFAEEKAIVKIVASSSSGAGSFTGKRFITNDIAFIKGDVNTIPGTVEGTSAKDIAYTGNELGTAAFITTETAQLVKTDSSDIPGYLDTKLIAGQNISITKSSLDGEQTLTFGVEGELDNKQVLVSADDTTQGYLGSKIVAGSNVAVTVLNDGANETLEISSIGGGGGLTVVYTTDVTLTASAGNLYLLDGTTTVNLPAGVNGAQIGFKDYAGDAGTTPVTVNRNSTDTIQGDTTLVINADDAYVQLVFYGGVWKTTIVQTFLI